MEGKLTSIVVKLPMCSKLLSSCFVKSSRKQVDQICNWPKKKTSCRARHCTVTPYYHNDWGKKKKHMSHSLPLHIPCPKNSVSVLYLRLAFKASSMSYHITTLGPEYTPRRWKWIGEPRKTFLKSCEKSATWSQSNTIKKSALRRH